MPISSVVLSSQRVPLSDAIYSVQQKLPADAVNPLVFDGQKLIPSVTRVFSKSRDFHVFLQAYQRAATTTQPLVAFVSFFRDGCEGVRDGAARRHRWAGPQDEGCAAAVHRAARRLPARPLRLSGDGARADRCEGHFLAGADRDHSLGCSPCIPAPNN